MDEKNWQESVLASIPDIAMVVNKDGNILYINHILPQFTREEVIGSSVNNYIPSAYHETYKEALKEVFGSSASKDFIVTGAGPNNSTSWYLTRIGPIKSGETVEAAAIISTDITPRMMIDDDLKAAKAEVDRLQTQLNELQK
ncbi:MAG: PAS domain-containing protein [bacterium]|nr:PAS domain-containing protein [bacterium]